MTLTLQEMAFIRADKKQLSQIPEEIIKDLKSKLGLRILKAWRRSKIYKINFIQCRIEEKKEVTKGALIDILIVRCLPEKPTILTLISKIHDYFHHHNEEEYLSNENMRQILSIITEKSKNNAHLFFGQLESLFSYADKIPISRENIIKIMKILPKKILLDMCRKTKK